MACLILTSCTEGNTTKLVTLPAASLSLIPFIGQHVSIIGYPGICFSVEQTENPCVDCEKADSIIPIAGNPVCSCTIPFLAYILTPCEGFKAVIGAPVVRAVLVAPVPKNLLLNA